MKTLCVLLLPCSAIAFSISQQHHAAFSISFHSTTKLGAFTFSNLLESSPFKNSSPQQQQEKTNNNAVKFVEALNEKRIDDALILVDDDIEFLDTEFFSTFQGKEKVERILRLKSDLGSSSTTTDQIVIEDVVFDSNQNKIGLLFRMAGKDGKLGNMCFQLDETSNLITNIFVTKENSKSGETNLKILRGASGIISLYSKGNKSPPSDKNEKIETEEEEDNSAPSLFPASFFQNKFPGGATTTTKPLLLPEQYFQGWNDRDIDKACEVFDENVEYDDTAFPSPFVGKENLKKHLKICADCFPSSLSFVVDYTINGGDTYMVAWHAESNVGEELPFTKGRSYYKANKEGKIIKAVDIVEPAVFKTGGISLVVDKFISEPIRLLPLTVWAVYMYVVFFSDWFFGMPATAFEQRTWEEVRDLSLNFFFVSPILNLPFSPIIHPMMEGVFNLLLSWAALFAGFLSDDRRDKPNLLPMLPTVAGMQFLTSAFLLPFLATRSKEQENSTTVVYNEDLSPIAQAIENPILGLAMGGVGTTSIVWALFARMQDFGGWEERYPSFLQLLSIDRVGSSFLVDLAIFALFQGWLVDDDLKRRNMTNTSALATIAKFVPFFGMAAYIIFRDPLPKKGAIDDN